MAYIIQQRRDTIENWNAINPVLADAEIGFISDIDATTGKQKSSLYKIGDGKTDWKNLPLFGFGGNVYDNWSGSDLSTSVASRRAILEKLTNIIEGTEETEGLLNKLSNTQLVQIIKEAENEFEGKTDEEKAEILKNQIVSRAILITEFNKVWEEINKNNEADAIFVKATEEQLQTLKEFAEEYKPIVDGLVETSEKHEKFIYGWDETIEGEEGEESIIVHHKGIDDKIAEAIETKLNNKNIILTQNRFEEINDFYQYEEGTIFYTYLENEEEN